MIKGATNGPDTFYVWSCDAAASALGQTNKWQHSCDEAPKKDTFPDMTYRNHQ